MENNLESNSSDSKLNGTETSASLNNPNGIKQNTADQQNPQPSNAQLANKIYPQPQNSTPSSVQAQSNLADEGAKKDQPEKPKKLQPIWKVLIGLLVVVFIGPTVLAFLLLIFITLFPASTSSGSKTM